MCNEVALNDECDGKDRYQAADELLESKIRVVKSGPSTFEEISYVQAGNEPFQIRVATV